MTSNEWYENLQFVSKLKEEFEKAGLPLEYRAKQIFKDKGFEAEESHYKDPNDHIFDEKIYIKEGIWRQIDIKAMPKDFNHEVNLTFGKFRLNIYPSFTAECKFSSNKKFFLFRSINKYIQNFPSIPCGHKLLPFKLHLFDSDDESFSQMSHDEPTDYFNLDVYENIVEVDFEHLEKKDKNFNDEITYKACEQIYNSINFDLSVHKPELRNDAYIDINESPLFRKWLLYLENNNIKKEDAMPYGNEILKSIALKFLKENFDLADIQNIFYSTYCDFPILIVNEKAGLFEVILDEKSNIRDFKKIKYGLYEYNSRECYNREYCIYPDSLGIIICDISHLSELIDIIIKGVQHLGLQLVKNLEKWPYLLGYELLFNPELINPNDIFTK